MDKKKARKTRTSGHAASGKDLSVKTLSARSARGVVGGVQPVDKSSPNLFQKCTVGTHMKE